MSRKTTDRLLYSLATRAGIRSIHPIHKHSVNLTTFQIVNLHFLLSQARVSARPSVLWCYKKDLGFTRQVLLSNVEQCSTRYCPSCHCIFYSILLSDTLE